MINLTKMSSFYMLMSFGIITLYCLFCPFETKSTSGEPIEIYWVFELIKYADSYTVLLTPKKIYKIIDYPALIWVEGIDKPIRWPYVGSPLIINCDWLGAVTFCP